MPGAFTYAEESPIGALVLRTAAALAEGRIPFGCAHPVTADRLYLHLEALICAECADAMVTDPGPGECAACGAPDGSVWHYWHDEAARVTVAARTCVWCVMDGNATLDSVLAEFED